MLSDKVLLAGILFGATAPLIGLFAGLQIAPLAGNILLFPFVITSLLTGEAPGDFSTGATILLWMVSIIVWGALFKLGGKLVAKRS